jgi:L,D-transpeptidase ErfK/SrfK
MRRLMALLFVSLLAGCATQQPAPPPDPEAAFAAPLAMSEFVIDPKHDDVIGEVQIIRARHEDTLSDIARRFNVGYEEIVAANPDVDPWLPSAGTEVVIPTQWVLPDVPRTGIVINLAAMRLFYFPKAAKGEPQRVITHPVGIGRVEWNTPQGRTRVIAKTEAPTWIPTAAIRREHAQNGDPLPAKVPPGPDNPMGSHVLRLGWPEYAIHGTNKPASIGLRGTHGCLRMYPEDIESIYEIVPVGTPVTVLNEPHLAGLRDDTLYLQSYPILEDDKRNHARRPEALIKAYLKKKGKNVASNVAPINSQLVSETAQNPRALSVPVSVAGLSVQQFLAQAPRVKNRLPQNATWDGVEEQTAEEDPSIKDEQAPAEEQAVKEGQAGNDKKAADTKQASEQITSSLNGLSSAQP